MLDMRLVLCDDTSASCTALTSTTASSLSAANQGLHLLAGGAHLQQHQLGSGLNFCKRPSDFGTNGHHQQPPPVAGAARPSGQLNVLGRQSTTASGAMSLTPSSVAPSSASGLLSHFLLLNPLNPDFKRIYFSMLPKVVAEALDSGSTTIEDCKHILSFFASNPQLSWDERQIVENLASQVEDVRRLKHSLNKSRSNSTAFWSGVAGPTSMSPSIYQKNRRSMSLITGGEDVFSRMKTFRCEPTIATDESSSSSSPTQIHQKTSFNEPNSGMKDVPSWLKSLRLHKYSPLFAHMTYDEMMQLTEDRLENKGVTVGARRKIVLSIQKLKDRVNVLKQLEKDLVDVSRVPITLSELRTIIGTPIRPKRVDQAESEDIPIYFTRTLVKACSYLLSSPIGLNGTIDDDCFSVAVYVVDRCLNHEAFMPQQKKRLASLKQEMRRIWSPQQHHRRFSLPTHTTSALAAAGALPFAAGSPCLPPAAVRTMGTMAGAPHSKCFDAAAPNAFFLPPISNLKCSATTSADVMPPLISLFNQHCSLQHVNGHQSLQRTASAPSWNRPASAVAASGSCAPVSTTTGDARVSRLAPSPPKRADPTRFSASHATNGAAVASTTTASSANSYSPWSSFYTVSQQRSAWSCGFDDGDSGCRHDVTSVLSGKPLASELLKKLVAQGNGSAPVSITSIQSAPVASSSFTEYSIDQLCRSMVDAIDC